MNEQQLSTKQVWLLIAIAYAFSFAIRLIWVYQFKDNPAFYWNHQLMINTNDGYFFASGAQQALFGLHEPNPRIPNMWDYGIVFFTTLFAKITPFSLETVLLYLPSVISSLVVIPMVLIARLYKKTWWGFFAALLGSITWSYYNRTMTGYYDTDMFSAMAPMFILYFLMKSTIDLKLKTAFYAAIATIFYPFLYDQGQSIIYAIGIIYALYMIVYHRKDENTYSSLILIFVALTPLGVAKPYLYLVQLLLVSGVYLFLKSKKIEEKRLMIATAIAFVLFLALGDVFGLIYSKVMGYLAHGTIDEGGLHFFAVNQTVREAGKIPFSIYADRTSGSVVGVIVALLGYLLLVWKKRPFILALPLIGIGVFAMWGGLRFTVYAVPVAAMSAIYLFYFVAEKFIVKERAKYVVVGLATAVMLYPNIEHIIGYRVPTVLNKSEVQDLAKLGKLSNAKDYTLSWWDYGYPIWYYSDTSTLIDGGKHDDDNFIISQVMFSTSQTQVANLARLAVEKYVSSGYKVVSDEIFKDTNPNLLLDKMKTNAYEAPKKTRDVYLYMPYRMMNIFPTVGLFSNVDLTNGNKKRNIIFYPTRAVSQQGNIVRLQNGIVLDVAKGIIHLGRNAKKISVITQVSLDKKFTPHSRVYRSHLDGQFAVLFLKSYGQVIVMDNKTYESAYVQMFMLGNYDKNLFELVVASPYSRIYKLKR